MCRFLFLIRLYEDLHAVCPWITREDRVSLLNFITFLTNSSQSFRGIVGKVMPAETNSMTDDLSMQQSMQFICAFSTMHPLNYIQYNSVDVSWSFV